MKHIKKCFFFAVQNLTVFKSNGIVIAMTISKKEIKIINAVILCETVLIIILISKTSFLKTNNTY